MTMPTEHASWLPPIGLPAPERVDPNRGLPQDNPVWPPAECAKPDALVDMWHAWYSGDPDRLMAAYADRSGPFGADRKPAQGGGAVTSLLRAAGQFVTNMFWGTPPPDGEAMSNKFHVPLASDIAMKSAELMFSEPPAIKFEDHEATEKLVRSWMIKGGLQATLLECAEQWSAYGGGYLRVTVDQEVSPERPIFDFIPPDAAVPTFRHGRLLAVTFHRIVGVVDGMTYRHLERHERGRIIHGLYASRAADRLGRSMPLTDHPETERFAGMVDAEGAIATETPLLTAEYVPNMRPHRILRGSPLGRSDYSGIEPTMDKLDAAWTSWMWDIEAGKGRIIVPETYMSSHGRGQGASFNLDRRVFTSVNALTSPEAGMALQMVQFAIRVMEHKETCAELVNVAVRGAGYSASSFGEDEGAAMTATEVVARQRTSYATRGRKILYATEPLSNLIQAALALYVAHWPAKSDIKVEPPELEWPDGVTVDPEAGARTLQMLHAAESVSLYERVRRVNPDWKPEEIDKEVERIRADAKAMMEATTPPTITPPGGGLTGRGPNGEPLPGKPGQGAPGPGGQPKPATAAGGATKPAPGAAGPGSRSRT